MSGKRKVPMILGALLLLFMMGAPLCANAATAPTDPCNNTSGNPSALDTAVQTNAARIGMQKMQANNQALALFGAIDVKLQACWSQIQATFSALGNLSDPLAIIWGVIASQILNMINQLCSMVLADIKDLEKVALSQFNRICLPLPHFGLGPLGTLNLQGVTCNGVSPLSPSGSLPVTALPIYDPRKFYPTSPGQ